MTNEELQAIESDIALALDHQEGVSPPVVSRLVAEVRRLKEKLRQAENAETDLESAVEVYLDRLRNIRKIAEGDV